MKKQAALVLLLLTAPAFVRAGEQELYPTDEWAWRFAPVVGPQTFDGTAVVGNDSRSFDRDISELGEKVVFNILAQVEGWKGHWGILMEGSFSRLWGAKTTNNQHAEYNGNLYTFDMAGSYGFGPLSLSNSSLGLEVIAGGRFYYLETELAFDPGESHRNSAVLIEPVVGSRLTYNFLDNWRAEARGDVGGISSGNSSENSWKVLGAVHYQTTSGFDVFAGYRIFDIDMQKQNGATRTELNGRISGPVIGITFLFADLSAG